MQFGSDIDNIVQLKDLKTTYAVLVKVIQKRAHPDEGPCPVCEHIFDAHNPGCVLDFDDLIGGWRHVG